MRLAPRPAPLLALLATMLAFAPADAAPRKKRPKAKPTQPRTTRPPEPTPPPTPAPADVAAPSVPVVAPTSPPPPAGAPASPSVDAASPPSDDPRERPAKEADVDTLRQEYLALRDELFRSRARAGTVASALYSTRIQIKLTYTSGRFYNPAKSTIRLDGASVYENATGAIAGDDGLRFDGHVAPGRHVVTFRVEATGKDDDSFTSVTEAQIVVKAVAGKDLVIAAKAKDSGDIAYAWKRKEHGSYGLGIDVAVKTQPRADRGKR